MRGHKGRQEFRERRIILSGLELGVFESLMESSKTAREFAASRDLDPRAAEILLDALASLGVLRKTNGCYSIASACRPALDPESPECIVPGLMHTLGMWRRWADLTEVVRRGHPLPGAAQTASASVSPEPANSIISRAVGSAGQRAGKRSAASFAMPPPLANASKLPVLL